MLRNPKFGDFSGGVRTPCPPPLDRRFKILYSASDSARGLTLIPIIVLYSKLHLLFTSAVHIPVHFNQDFIMEANAINVGYILFAI